MNTSFSLIDGLEDALKLNELKMMGAIVNPLMQCDGQMVASGICTQLQFEHRKKQLIHCMTRYSEHISSNVCSKHTVDTWAAESNKWSKFVKQQVEDTPCQRAIKEFDRFEAICDGQPGVD